MDNQPKEKKSKEKTITVDAGKCIGCGLCVTTCPDVFELGDDGKSHVKNAAACSNCNCQETIDDCPAKAIGWSEDQKSEIPSTKS